MNSWNPGLCTPSCRMAKERYKVWQQWDTKGGWDTRVLILSHVYKPSQEGWLQHVIPGAFSRWSGSHFACQISQLETWAMPTRNLGVFEQIYSSPAAQHARKSNISLLARRDVAKKLVKNVLFQEVISGWEKSLSLMPFVEVVNGAVLQRRRTKPMFQLEFHSCRNHRLFCLFFLEKACRLLYRGLLIYPTICSRRLVMNQHQLELSRSI